MTAHILVIEDNAANLELIRYLLSYSGYTVLQARDGTEGVDMARREQPDLVICDLQLPELDGYEVLQSLREDPTSAATIIVAVTAFSMPNDKQKVITVGFNGYLSKPIDPEMFVQQIEAYLPLELRAPRPVTNT